MLRALLVDDELPACKTLKWLIEENISDLTVAGFAHSANEARHFLSQQKIDLIFLDISMPGETGFDLLSTLTEGKYAVIFVTAHNEYAIKAFKTEALDYLLKPIDIDELKFAVNNVIKNSQTDKLSNIHKESLSKINSHLNSDRITIPHLEGLKIIEFAEIVYLEADSNYTIFHLMNAQKFVSSKTMGEFEPLLTGHFFRIHKSFVINLNHVAEYSKKNGNNVIMKEGSILPIARRRFQEFMHVLSNG